MFKRFAIFCFLSFLFVETICFSPSRLAFRLSQSLGSLMQKPTEKDFVALIAAGKLYNNNFSGATPSINYIKSHPTPLVLSNQLTGEKGINFLSHLMFKEYTLYKKDFVPFYYGLSASSLLAQKWGVHLAHLRGFSPYFRPCSSVLPLNWAYYSSGSLPERNARLNFIYNTSSVSEELSLKKVFQILGADDLYDKYQEELESLDRDFNLLSSQGALILLGIKSDILNEVLIPFPYEESNSNKLASGSSKPDIKKMIRALYDDRMKQDVSFGLKVGADQVGHLNFKNQSKAFVFRLINEHRQNNLTLFNQKESSLFQKIKADLLQRKNA